MAKPRETLMARFIASHGWGAADCAPLAGDASGRRYFRLSRGAETAVLMDADPGQGEKAGPFVAVGGWLAAQGYSAPQVLADDAENGFLLLEDLGDALFVRLADESCAREAELYHAATDFLCDLHDRPPPAFLPRAGGPELAALAELAVEAYLPAVDVGPNAAARRITAELAALYDRLNVLPAVVSLRDFHAGNLIWLSRREGIARVGLLDYQDAFVTHPSYDLVSLLQDARRDVPAALEADCLQRYLNRKGLEQSRFGATYALVGAQRALRIIGVFARLAVKSGKVQYLAFLPRVWACLMRNLADPALAPLALAVREGLPEPTPDRIARIAAKCPTR